MSFTIQIGHMTSPHNQLSKKFNVIYELEGTLKDSCDVLNPTITLRTGSTPDPAIYVPTITKCNYMYIENFNRYYYITDFNVSRNVVLNVSGHVDVLMTYKNQIRNNTGLILRSATDFNKLLDDGCFKVYSDDIISVQKFSGSTFTRGSFVLAVAGSSQS